MSKNNVLIIDDSKSDIDMLAEALGDEFELSAAVDGTSGLELAKDGPTDIILLDVNMPDMDGFEVCRRLKADGKTHNIPVIFLTARTEAKDETRGFELGAVDYITKPFFAGVVKARVRTHLSLINEYEKNKRLKNTLRKMITEEFVEGTDPSFQEAMKLARSYAATDYPVLIYGESGTGKELVARDIHKHGDRSDMPFYVQNCSAIPHELLESELFGYKRGAFTGANTDKKGLFEAAHKGTIFLDEIGEMDIRFQAKLLRILQFSEFKPLGANKARNVDVRIIAATNKDLNEAVRREEFREDLLYRLNVLPLKLPCLRERKRDIPLFLNHFMKREAKRMGSEPKSFSREALDILCRYPWPGNVRELENFVKQLTVVISAEEIQPSDLPPKFHYKPDACGTPDNSISAEPGFSLDGLTWQEVEKAYVMHLLDKHHWNISRAAKAADINRSTFNARLQKLGVRKDS